MIACHNEARKKYTYTAVALVIILAYLLLATGDRGACPP